MIRKKNGPNTADWVEIISKAFLGYKEATNILGTPKTKLLIGEDLTGVRLIYSVSENKVLRRRADEWLMNEIIAFHGEVCSRRLDEAEPPTLSKTMIQTIVVRIKGGSNCIAQSDIKAFDWPNGSDYCFHRLNFMPDANAPTPLFDSMVARIKTDTQRKNFLSILGALFDLDHRLEKYLWLYGAGGDGKGSLFSLMMHIFGDAGTTFVTESKKLDKYWTATFEGKRVAIATDVKNFNVIHSEDFMSVTGDDIITVRRMHQVTTFAPNNVIIMIGSNDLPNIKFDKSTRRRAVYVELTPKEGPDDPTFKTRLHGEAAGIVGKVIQAWQETKNQHNGLIPEDTETLDQLAEENTAHFMDVFHRVAKLDPKGSCTTVDLHKRMAYYLPKMESSTYEQGEFSKWLKFTHKIVPTRPYTKDSPRITIYEGVTLRIFHKEDGPEKPAKKAR